MASSWRGCAGSKPQEGLLHTDPRLHRVTQQWKPGLDAASLEARMRLAGHL